MNNYYISSSSYLEFSYILLRDEAREVAKKYYACYLRKGYNTHIYDWHITKE